MSTSFLTLFNRTEDDTASLALDVERLAQHITIYKVTVQFHGYGGIG